MRRVYKFIFLPVMPLIAGCVTGKPIKSVSIADNAPVHIPVDIASIPDAIPRFEPRSNSVNPKSYQVLNKRYTVLADSKGYVSRGIASWYGTKFHGKNTANGETYDMFAMTAAHKTLPIPSYVRVTNLHNRRSIVVRINDRGPFHENRIIDLSYTAAIKLGIQQQGTGFVEVRALQPGQSANSNIHTRDDHHLIYLQVGAFNSEYNALDLKTRINAVQKINSRIKSDTIQGMPFFKLQLGPIHSVAEADLMNRQLDRMGITETHFVIENNSSADRMIQ